MLMRYAADYDHFLVLSVQSIDVAFCINFSEIIRVAPV